MAGWELKHEKLPNGTSNVPDMKKYANKDGSGIGGRAAWSFMEPNIYLFEGADLEELNFDVIRERNRKRAHGELAGDTVEKHGVASDEDGSDEDDMDGMTNETSKRRLLTRDYRGGSTGPMDEDEPEVNDGEEGSDTGSEESQGTLKGPSISQGLTSPLLQPRGFASGTTEPRSGSITKIHQSIVDATKEESSASISSSASLSSGLRSPTFAIATGGNSQQAETLAPPVQEGEDDGDDDDDDDDDGGDDDDDDDDEEAKIRVMFTEKMPKDLGEEQGDGDGPFGHGHSLGHSLQPNEDLRPITEDSQGEVEEEDKDNSGDGAQAEVPSTQRS